MKSKKLRFPGSTGVDLAGRIDLPDESEPTAFALFAHCFTCSKDFKAVVNISKALTARGLGVFRFDFTGLGESEGDFADTTFSSNIDDLLAAITYMADEFETPRILIGHSLGGAAVIQAALKTEECRAVGIIAAPYDPSHVKHLLSEKADEIERKGEATVTIAGRSFTIKKQFLDDLENEALKTELGNLRRPLIVFHSPIDNVVGIDNAAKIFMAAKHPKSFISLDQADHILSNERDSKYTGAIIAEWASKYV